MRASLTVLVIALLAIVALSTSGCGLKGDLYLPDEEPENTPAPTTTQDESEKAPADPDG